MTIPEWREFFLTAARVLGGGHFWAERSKSWCAWTTFSRLTRDAGYWTGGLPAAEDVLETYLRDGGVWGQPFGYDQIAHILIPREFTWESAPGPNFTCGAKCQDVQALSVELNKAKVPHRLTDLVLEVKCY